VNSITQAIHEQLIVAGDLQADLKWYTTADLQTEHNVPPYMVYRWGAQLQANGLAQKLVRGRRGVWLVAPEAIEFLKSRAGKRGRPKLLRERG